MPVISGGSPCASCSDPAVYRMSVPPFSFREAWRFLIAHAAGISPGLNVCSKLARRTETPVQPDCCALSGNYHLESNPDGQETPLAAAIGNWIYTREILERSWGA